jgi:hypothetical protein
MDRSATRLRVPRRANGVLTVVLKRANALGHTDTDHYVWCASQHHNFDPTKPASKWDTAWHVLQDAAGLPGFRFHDLRHTVVTDWSIRTSRSIGVRSAC